MRAEFQKIIDEIIKEINERANSFKKISDFFIERQNYDESALNLGTAIGLLEARKIILSFIEKAKSQKVEKNK